LLEGQAKLEAKVVTAGQLELKLEQVAEVLAEQKAVASALRQAPCHRRWAAKMRL